MSAFIARIEGYENEPLFVLALTTGMRRGEICGLRWRDIDFGAARLSVRQTLNSVEYGLVFGEPKSARSRRSVPLPDLAIEHLRRQQVRQAAWREVMGRGWRQLERSNLLDMVAASLRLQFGERSGDNETSRLHEVAEVTTHIRTVFVAGLQPNRRFGSSVCISGASAINAQRDTVLKSKDVDFRVGELPTGAAQSHGRM